MQVLSTLMLAGAGHAALVNIAVGDGGLRFTPTMTTAAIGDTVVFSFVGGEHAVAQTSLKTPCEPINGSFYSGVVQGGNSPLVDFKINITTVDPIYYYCPVGKHCQAGMIGIINPPNGNLSLSAYSVAAKNVSSNVTPNVTAGSGGCLDTIDLKLNMPTNVAKHYINATNTTNNDIAVATVTSTLFIKRPSSTSTDGQMSATGTQNGVVKTGSAKLLGAVYGVGMAVMGLVI